MPTALGQNLWNYSPSRCALRGTGCNIPRDDGLSYGDYVEQTRIVGALA